MGCVYFEDTRVAAGSAVDIHILLAERRHIGEQLRSTLTRLSILRAQFSGRLTEEARQHVRCAINEEAEVFRDLGNKLLKFDATILEMQTERLETARPKYLEDYFLRELGATPNKRVETTIVTSTPTASWP